MYAATSRTSNEVKRTVVKIQCINVVLHQNANLSNTGLKERIPVPAIYKENLNCKEIVNKTVQRNYPSAHIYQHLRVWEDEDVIVRENVILNVEKN